MRSILIISVLLTSALVAFGQEGILPSDKIVFVMYEKEYKNYIVIPNLGKLKRFKIYRKLKSETEYKFMIELKKPPLPMRYKPTPYAVDWEDPDFHSREIDYKVLAFDKKGNELCEMVIIWEKETQNKKESGIKKDSVMDH